jgi:alanyl-tRNA synthetase
LKEEIKMTIRQYLFNTALTGQTMVTTIGNDEGRPWVKLKETLFHPQGGGQPADHGTINGIPVLHVVSVAGGEDVIHYLEREGLCVGDVVTMQVEPERRQRSARLHTAGHLIAALIEHNFPSIKATGGHHWPGEARVEFNGQLLPSPPAVQEYLDDALVESIRRADPVEVIAELDGPRAIQIGKFPQVPCGGTHVANTSVLQKVVITRVSIKKGALRVSYEVE